MALELILAKSKNYRIYCRQFVEGAIEAAKDRGITVIIDNFRASNTILSLIDAGATIKPVSSTEEAMSYINWIKVGEEKRDFSRFDFDNSPDFIDRNKEIFRGKNVIVRTTNGTVGLINAIGSKFIVIGAFRNLSSVVNFCYKHAIKDIPISFVAMGSEGIPRIEDIYGAKMMFYKLLDKLGEDYPPEKSPWNRDWRGEIIEERPLTGKDGDDRLYSLELDVSDKIPIYNPQTGLIELINE